MGSLELMVKSMLDLRQLEAFSMPSSSHKKGSASWLRERDAGSTSSLQGALVSKGAERKRERENERESIIINEFVSHGLTRPSPLYVIL